MKMNQALCLAFTGLLVLAGCGREKTYEAEIKRLQGHHLALDNGETVRMVGVYIPIPGSPNYDPESFQYVFKLLLGKRAGFRTVEEKHETGYPYFDLVEVTLEGMNVNQHLLKTGKAFFNEDHWDKDEKRAYRESAHEAEAKRLGIWEKKDDFEVLFIRPRKGRFAHFPDCPHVKGLKPEERVDYFVPLPRSPFLAVRYAFLCDYCRPIFDEKFGLSEKLNKK